MGSNRTLFPSRCCPFTFFFHLRVTQKKSPTETRMYTALVEMENLIIIFFYAFFQKVLVANLCCQEVRFRELCLQCTAQLETAGLCLTFV